MELPLARKDNLTVRELAEETLVYDHARDKAHCLNATAALVWKLCDGHTSLGSLAATVGRALGVADGAPVVRLALKQLAGRHLLEDGCRPAADAGDSLSRRQALKQLAAVVSLPLVMTITASTAAAISPCSPSNPFGPCPVGTCCFGTCQNTLTDVNHCGSCFNKCPAGSTCVLGRCQKPCLPVGSPCTAGQVVCCGANGTTVACPPGGTC